MGACASKPVLLSWVDLGREWTLWTSFSCRQHRMTRRFLCSRWLIYFFSLFFLWSGRNVKAAKDILTKSGMPLIPADDMDDAAKKVVDSLTSWWVVGSNGRSAGWPEITNGIKNYRIAWGRFAILDFWISMKILGKKKEKKLFVTILLQRVWLICLFSCLFNSFAFFISVWVSTSAPKWISYIYYQWRALDYLIRSPFLYFFLDLISWDCG